MAQVETVLLKQSIIDLLEAQAENPASQNNYFELGEKLNELLINPLDINHASAEDFEETLLFTAAEIHSILNYRAMYGAFVEVNELKATEMISYQKVETLAPILTVKSIKVIRPLTSEHEFLMRSKWQSSKNEDHQGDNYSFLFKETVRSTALDIGLTLEKDQGEPFYANNMLTENIDFVSGFLSFKPQSDHIKKIIVGDYSLKVGQGLLFWNSYAFGGYYNNINTGRTAPILSGYRSVNEQNYLRGTSAEFRVKQFSFIPFISYKKLNARLSDSIHFTTIYQDGLHRTPSEIERRNTVQELNTGIVTNWNRAKTRYGLAVAYSRYDKLHVPTFLTDTLQQNIHTSFDYKFYGQQVSLSGEVAVSNFHSLATIHNMHLRVSKTVATQFSYRYYSPEFYAIYENALKSSTRANNEHAFFMGLDYYPFYNVKITCFADWKSHIRSSPNKLIPEKKNNQGIQIQYTPSSRSIIYLRWSQRENYYVTGKYDLHTFQDASETKTNIRLDYTQVLDEREQFKLRSRIETSNFNVSEKGLLLFQDFYHRISFKFKYNLRIAYFNTPSFNSSIYAYESDVLYAFNTTAYFDKGSKVYLNINFNPVKNFKIWLRTSMTFKPTYYPEQEHIQSNKLWDVSFQVLYSF